MVKKKTLLSKLEINPNKKISNKKIIKSEKPTLKIKHKEVESTLGDMNRFFKGEMEETKKSMFFK